MEMQMDIPDPNSPTARAAAAYRKLLAPDALLRLSLEERRDVLARVAETDNRGTVRSRAKARLRDLAKAGADDVAQAVAAVERVADRIASTDAVVLAVLGSIADPRVCVRCRHIGPMGRDFGFNRHDDGAYRSRVLCYPCQDETGSDGTDYDADGV
jgi:hypothetical protein